MAVYCIGDLHGCYDEFMRLLERIRFDQASDQLWLTGDLVGRGPKPLETLNVILELQDHLVVVMGNHDMNFLAVCCGERKPRPQDNLQPLLRAPNLEQILDFYLKIPFFYLNEELQLAMSHAGIYPGWELSQARKLSKEMGKIMKDPLIRPLLLRNMYQSDNSAGNHTIWNKEFQGLVRWRFVINAFTTMRLCTRELALDFGHSSSTVEEAAKDELYPWFDFSSPMKYKKNDYTLVFGHWAALGGDCSRSDIHALDTGCVWGGALSCWCYDTGRFIRIKSLEPVRR